MAELEKATPSFNTEKKVHSKDFYPVKVWAATILISPIVLFVSFCIKWGGGSGSDLSRAGLLLLVGAFYLALLSFPVLALYWYVLNVLRKTQDSFWRLRLMLCCFSAGLICMIFILTKSSFSNQSDLLFFAVYQLVSIAATWIIKFNEERKS